LEAEHWRQNIGGRVLEGEHWRQRDALKADGGGWMHQRSTEVHRADDTDGDDRARGEYKASEVVKVVGTHPR
jgi:hypothetical protein